MTPISNSKQKNAEKVNQVFQDHISRLGERGVFGIANFQDVFSNLMPVQKERIRILCDTSFNDFIENGSIISIGVAYRGEVIDCINTTNNHDTDFDLWNHYANENSCVTVNNDNNSIKQKMTTFLLIDAP